MTIQNTGQQQAKTRSDENIKQLARNISIVAINLEAHSMDMLLYSKQLANGYFPQTHIIQVANALESAEKELAKLKTLWLNLFKEDKNEPN